MQFEAKFSLGHPCKSFPTLAPPYLAKFCSKFLNRMVDEKEILQDSTWQNIYLWKTSIAQLWWAPLIRVCLKHFKDIRTPKFCALCLVRTHPPHITAETKFPTKLFLYFVILYPAPPYHSGLQISNKNSWNKQAVTTCGAFSQRIQPRTRPG